tara:strand:+ start:16926 stop:17525 length:600 start_codon:yes stop_codon:yes gene_type:complete
MHRDPTDTLDFISDEDYDRLKKSGTEYSAVLYLLQERQDEYACNHCGSINQQIYDVKLGKNLSLLDTLFIWERIVQESHENGWYLAVFNFRKSNGEVKSNNYFVDPNNPFIVSDIHNAVSRFIQNKTSDDFVNHDNSYTSDNEFVSHNNGEFFLCTILNCNFGKNRMWIEKYFTFGFTKDELISALEVSLAEVRGRQGW